MARSRLRRLPEVRAKLLKLPRAAQDELLDAFGVIGTDIEAAMRLRAPKKSGSLREGITHKVFPQTLRLEVGLRGTKAGRAKLFYGRIQDLGRKGQTVIVQRLVNGGRAAWLQRVAAGKARTARKPRDLVATYALRVKPMAGKKFVTGQYTELRQEARTKLQGIYARAIGQGGAANG